VGEVSRSEGADGAEPILAFVGIVIPDEARYHGPAFNRAGQMFQRGLVDGLTAAGLPPDVVFSIEPLPAVPRSRRVFGGRGQFTISGGIPVRLLTFVNVHPFKWFTAGVSVFLALLRWNWRHRRRPRVVHCVNLTMPPGLMVLLAARLTGARAVVSVLDVFRPGGLVPDTSYRRADFALQRWLLPKFDGWMVVSQAIGDDLLPGRQVCRIEGGIVPERFGEAPPMHQGGRFRIVLVGVMDAYNGVDLLFDALPYLPQDCELILAGVGPHVDRIRAIAAADPRVSYRGFLDFEQVLELYRSSDLLLNLRITKTLDTRYFFPSKLMELLASGVAVLSTCTGHVEEEYSDFLYLLRDETPQGLSEKIREIKALSPEERFGLGRRARAFMLDQKTWARQGERLVHYIRHGVLTGAAARSTPGTTSGERVQ
jgi:glycosyltransferase involved in cell wall biosynthesis